ncbi:MAG: M13 family metallopeptidase [Vicinamibacteraceae bacterium]
MPLSIALLSLSFFALATADVRAQTSDGSSHGPVVSKPESRVDTSAAPGDDFFAYANGAWLKAAVIPPGKDRWTVRDDLNALTRRQIAAILDDPHPAPPGTVARMVADFRAALLNEAAIERKGLAPIAPMLARIDKVGDKAALTRLLGSSMRADVDPLNIGIYASSSVLGFSVEHSIHGEQTYSAFLVQGGLGLEDRERYLSQDPAAVEQRRRYRLYVARMLTLGGFDDAERRAESVLALEMAIAETHATRQVSAVDRNADHQWSRADFARDAPGVDWAAWLEAAGLGGQPVIVAWQPSAVKGVAALVASRPLDAWKDYLRFHAIADHADVLPRALAEAAAEMRGDRRSRGERALAATQEAMADAIGELYVARHVPADQKARVHGIVANVTKAFRARLTQAAWLSPAGRQIAVAKIDKVYVGIGYPDAWPDWSDVRIDAADACGNAQRLAERSRRLALARLTKPYDQREWALTPQTSGAVLNFQQNAYLFAAALLQPPKYDATASDAATYGAIGALIGHDLSHFVDVLGAGYEPDGRMRRWWTPAETAAFDAAAEPLVRQFAAYEPLPGLHVDGRLTRTENVADLAGLVAAFEAHRTALGARAADKDHVRRADREFFIAFAQAFGSKMTDAGLRAQVAGDHAPETFRMSTVRNVDAWYEAFDVVPGQRLYVEPQARVRVW